MNRPRGEHLLRVARDDTALPLPRFPDQRGFSSVATHLASSTMDDRGRLANRSAVRSLGWHRGQTIDFTVADGVITVAEQEDSPRAIGVHDFLRIPFEVRICARIDRRDRVLLVAVIDRRVLMIYSSAQVLAALRSCSPQGWAR